MKTGIIEIIFKEGTSNETIQELMGKFYNNNLFSIKGMEFKQLIDKQTLIDCKKAINNVCNPIQEQIKQSVALEPKTEVSSK